MQTSAASVALLPEAKDLDIEVNLADCKIETFRASGPGGQHRNTTDSAVRIIHLPTQITATACEKSQHQNKEEAMRVLKARIYQQRKGVEDGKRNRAKQEQLGSGDRSEKVRTYNWPQNRVTDHRLGKNYPLTQIVAGNLGSLLGDLSILRQEQLLAEK